MVTRTRPIARLLVLALVFLGASATTARAAAAFDIAAGLSLGDDDRIFLNVTNGYYAPQREMAIALVHRSRDPVDDYPCVLLLARASHRPPAQILDMRLGGMDWADIMFGLHVAPSVLFAGMDHDPGPPYGKAWGYWKKNPRGRLEIRDRHFVELAKLRVTTGAYGLSPYAVVTERRNGVRYESYVAERHRQRERSGKAKPGKPEHGQDQGRGHGHGQDNEHGHGQHKEHGHR